MPSIAPRFRPLAAYVLLASAALLAGSSSALADIIQLPPQTLVAQATDPAAPPATPSEPGPAQAVPVRDAQGEQLPAVVSGADLQSLLADPSPAPVVEPAVPAPPLVAERVGQDGADLSVTGTTDRAVWAGGRQVQVASTSPDAFAAGETVDMRGTIHDNLVAAGRDVRVAGPVGGDAFLFGKLVELGNSVSGDAYVAAETLRVPEGVEIGGNLYFGGANLDLDGKVGGDLLGGGAELAIDGSVGGDVDVEAATLRVGRDARIGGDVRYRSPSESGDILGSVTGEVDWTRTPPDQKAPHRKGAGHWIGLHLFLLAGALICGLVLLWLFPALVERPAAVVRAEAPASLGWGFAVLVGVPVLALVLAIFILPIPLSVLAVSLWLPATYVARLVLAVVLGRLLLERKPGRVATPFGALAVGLVLLHLLYAIPWVGQLAALVATALGLGALAIVARRATRREVAAA